MSSRSKGTMLKMVSKPSLENLEVKLPSLERQKTITEYVLLSIKERNILDTIKHYRGILAHGNLTMMLSEYPSHSTGEQNNEP